MNILFINKKIFSKEAFILLKKNKHNVFSSNKLKRINDFEVLIIRPDTFITASDIKIDTKIKYIITISTGTNHLDLNFLKKRGIKVLYLQNKNFLKQIHATSEHTLFLILSALRKSKIFAKNINFKNKFIANELHSTNLGILGFGRVGRHVAKLAHSFGANLFAYDVCKKNYPKYVHQCNSMSDLFKRSKIISIHINLNSKNTSVINQKHTNLLKNKFLINTSRAEIIDEKFLIKMLQKNQFNYATDVIHKEELNYKLNLLSKFDRSLNLIVTPHVAGLTEESIKKTDIYLINKFLESL